MYKQTLYFPLVLFFVLLGNLLQAQILYQENFDNPGEGVKGPQPPVITPTSGSWYVSGDFSGLTASSDYFQTGISFGDGRLEARDIDQIICFESEAVDISGYVSATVSFDLFEDGDLEVGDFVDIILTVDGFEQTITNYMGLGSADHSLTGDLPDDDDFQAVTFTSEVSGSSLVINICMINNAGTEQFSLDNVLVEAGEPIVNEPPSEGISSFTLINAQTNQPVAGYDPIPDGANIDLLAVGTGMLNIRANTGTSQPASVKLELERNGQRLTRVENYAPYALFGDSRGNYFMPTYSFWKMLFTTPPGPFTLTATPYDQSQGKGNAGLGKSLNFTISFGGFPLKTGFSIPYNISVYPNPTTGFVVVSGNFPPQSDPIRLEILNSVGLVVYQSSVLPSFSQKINLSDLSNGTYLVKATGNYFQDFKKNIATKMMG